MSSFSFRLHAPTSKQKEKLPLGQLSYEIRTHSGLFRNYLQNSEPIQIEIYSLKTDLLIGSSKVRIPLKIVNFEVFGDIEVAKVTAQICNTRNFNLGELIMTIKLLYSDKSSMKPAENVILKTTAEKEVTLGKDLLRIDGISMRNPGRKKKSVEEDNLLKSVDEEIHKSKKQSILNYLCGKPLDKNDENQILQEIISTSPAQSIIEALEEIKPKTAEDRLFELIDSIKMTVKTLEISDAGLMEVQRLNKDQEKFILKCFIVSSLLKSKEEIRVNTAVLRSLEKSEFFFSSFLGF